jgi:hypothetical protein
MAKRSQAIKDDVSLQAVDVSTQGVEVPAQANGSSSPLPPVEARDLNDTPLVPANDSMETSANGLPAKSSAAAASDRIITSAVDAIRPLQKERATTPDKGSSRKSGNGSARPAAAAADALPSADRGEVHVADISKNCPDSRGENIDFVFFTRRKCFAIYQSSGRILVQYADDEAESQKQVANIAELLPLRDRLQYLLSDMDIPSDTPHTYRWQIAESLRLGLVGQKDAAKRTMQAAIDNVVAKRVSDGRTSYLVWAGSLVISAIAVLGIVAATIYLFGSTPERVLPGLGYLMLATGSGAMGAMLSTAIALRDRTVGTDGWKSNSVDSATRIMIGVISAAVLYALLDSNVLSSFSVSIQHLAKDQSAQVWNVALVVGFLAGFLERLVPNLLEKKLAPALAK